MDTLSLTLLTTAAGVGFVHTVLGPDHWLPFVALARSRGWSYSRLAWITAACGAGHVVSSLALGAVAWWVGLAIQRIEGIESSRGTFAGWLLFGFGVAYTIWGARRAVRRSRGLEPHAHGPLFHVHTNGDATHAHACNRDAESSPATGRLPFWTLFVILVLGPCEPLVPLFLIPAGRGLWGTALIVAGVFGLVTIVSMIALTLAGLAGARLVSLAPLERWSHALAGGVIACSGFAVLYLGL